ncbi:Protein of unknown function [Pyronema omphalodes CBS 100304]|uniref:Uncharacterized protein n=1 Tax=Pyronema omphalodes (strain CBS 100304) TaxID=1076935 RepID=U4KUA7_PYROM|nr:Protein of unknown function [Pyronema omphalodes CBS 100304]
MGWVRVSNYKVDRETIVRYLDTAGPPGPVRGFPQG